MSFSLALQLQEMKEMIRGLELYFVYFQTWQLIVEHFKIGA